MVFRYDFYETKLAYHNSDETGNAMGIHFYAPTYTHGYLYLNDYEDIEKAVTVSLSDKITSMMCSVTVAKFFRFVICSFCGYL